MNHTLKQGLKKRRAPHSSPTEQISETQQQSIIDDLLTKAIDTELQFAVLGAIIWLTAALAYIYLLLFAEPNLTTPAPRNPPDPIYLLPLRLLSAATSFALAAVLLRPYAEGRRWLRQKYVVRGADLRRLQGWCVVVELLFAAYGKLQEYTVWKCFEKRDL